MADQLDLSEEQRSICDSPPHRRLVVIAGPGTGKTHTLIARVVSLVGQHDLVGGDELVVLSFSRSAVDEIRKRTRTLSGTPVRVASSTFDSYASRLLYLYGDDDPAGWDYDHRIKRATELVRIGGATDEIEQIRHVLVDEAQDLVGPRAEFVLALLSSLSTDVGFTVFGDPAQAIYNFEDGTEGTGASSFLQRVQHELIRAPERENLTVNYRCESGGRRDEIAALGSELAAEQVAPEVRRRIEELLWSLPTAGAIETVAPSLRRSVNLAILCRTNGIALAISSALYAASVPHSLRQRAEDIALPAWVADCVLLANGGDITRVSVERLACDCDTATQRWDTLRRLGGSGPDRASVANIVGRLARGDIPDDLAEPGKGAVIVSTVHRAKGLEFERVLIVPFDLGDDQWQSEARVLYVALTRSKREIMQLEPPDSKGLWQSAGRWIKSRGGNLDAIELRGSDSFAFDPTGVVDIPDERALEERSDYLRSQVSPGAPVTLALRPTVLNSGHPSYDVLHDNNPIGLTTAGFGLALSRIITGPPPDSIEGLHVESLVATTAAAAAVHLAGFVKYPIFITARVQGLGLPTNATRVRHRPGRKR